jgi:hypothetical protein
MSKGIEEALATAEAAGYRVDLLLPPAAAQPSAEDQPAGPHSV